jgi:predicted phage terminase large subunit-like protein
MKRRPKLSEQKFDLFADQLKSWITDSVSPFENDTPAKQKKRKAEALADPLRFCAIYLPHYFYTDFGEFHTDWGEFAELRDEVGLIGAPREHAKSTFFTLAMPLRNIVFRLRWFQLIISDTSDQATGFTVEIRSELEENPRLRHDFPEACARGKKWQMGDFIANGVRTLARGSGEKVRGLKNGPHRPDYGVADDFENDENVENPKLVEKGLRWLRRAVIGSMGKGYCFLMVGNLFHPKSVLSRLIAARDEEDGEKLYKSKVYAAWLDFGKETQRPLWPANWSVERLNEKRRAMGRKDFNAEMMNKVAIDGAAFEESWIIGYGPEELVNKRLVIMTAADPSATSTSTADFKSVLTIALDVDEMCVYVLHAWIRRGTPGQLFDSAYSQNDEYKSQAVAIEENMLKDYLHEAIQAYAIKRGRYIPWRAINHSTNKIARIIGTLQYLAEYGKLKFRRGHSDQEILIEQLLYLEDANTNDDGPDALEMAVSEAQGANFGPVEVTAVPLGTSQTSGWGGMRHDHGRQGYLNGR